METITITERAWAKNVAADLEPAVLNLLHACSTSQLRQLPYKGAIRVGLSSFLRGAAIASCTSLTMSRTRVWPDQEYVTHDCYFECSLEAALVHLIDDVPIEYLQEGFELAVIKSLNRAGLINLYKKYLEHPYAAYKLVAAARSYGEIPWLQ